MAHPYDDYRQDKVGKRRASKIGGDGSGTFSPPSQNQQKPQDPIDKHGANYNNDASGWVRGQSQNPSFKRGS
jgi:hypothetical protein